MKNSQERPRHGLGRAKASLKSDTLDYVITFFEPVSRCFNRHSQYYNGGSWTQDRASYIAIDHQGMRIREYRDLALQSLAPQGREEPEPDFDDLLAH